MLNNAKHCLNNTWRAQMHQAVLWNFQLIMRYSVGIFFIHFSQRKRINETKIMKLKR